MIRMKTSTLIVVLVVLGAITGIWFWMGTGKTSAPLPSTVADHKNATYIIDGQPVALVDGYAEAPAASGSASKTVTRYFGNEATGDLNGDRQDDIAFILTQDRGGSGTFFYAAAALKTADGYQSTNAILLGDRVAPQTTEIRNGQVIVNYAERKAGEPMTTQPSIGVSKYLEVQGTMLAEAPKVTYVNSSAEMITVDLPFPGAVTGKSFSVIGKARGAWFFEASFPVQVLDKNGGVLAQGIAQAQGDWMTSEFVPFKADIRVPDPYIGPATLVLKKDNPSGLPEHDASISFPFTIEY